MKWFPDYRLVCRQKGKSKNSILFCFSSKYLKATDPLERKSKNPPPPKKECVILTWINPNLFYSDSVGIVHFSLINRGGGWKLPNPTWKITNLVGNETTTCTLALYPSRIPDIIINLDRKYLLFLFPVGSKTPTLLPSGVGGVKPGGRPYLAVLWFIFSISAGCQLN